VSFGIFKSVYSVHRGAPLLISKVRSFFGQCQLAGQGDHLVLPHKPKPRKSRGIGSLRPNFFDETQQVELNHPHRPLSPHPVITQAATLFVTQTGSEPPVCLER